MFVVPALTAVTKPVPAFTDATVVFELLQVPPAVPLLVYVEVKPTQSGEVPLTVPTLIFADTVNDFDEETGPPHPLTIV